MAKLHLPLLLLVLALFTTLTCGNNNAAHIDNKLAKTTHDGDDPLQKVAADNETVYRVSKQLCWGCIGESLQFLFAQNLARATKWELPLIWDFQLEKYARWWAAVRQSDCKLQHSFPEGGFKLGENIFWGSGSSWTPLDAVKAWTDEEKYYSYATNTCTEGQMCGHYTQIVWRSTKRVGCARVVCEDGDVFMTCNYDPPGNYIGEKPY